MGNFFKSLFTFSSPQGEPTAEEQEKSKEKNFDILKYDGVRAQKMHKLSYAIRCFNEALNIHEDFETRSYLVTAYLASNQMEDALEQLNRMCELEPQDLQALQTRVHVLFMMDKDGEAILSCDKMIEISPDNAVAYFLRAKAKKATNDVLGAIADLTKAISLRDDFSEAYQLRADILLRMGQNPDALEDISKVVELNPEEELAYLLRGKIYAAQGDGDKASADF